MSNNQSLRGGEGGALKNDSVNHFSDEPGCRATPTTRNEKRQANT
ncbi:hypothetical protein B879_04005 [Cecembia lonarensis LW9]|uniref:Uncharacterized protein n=1 Tax=Cecembia lonarensis (strain CCUG 58316 / KCTC 22772 / LW9) TaxID=1225176 RepID=K1LAG8_CECL9|nr:hypothetical protein B879_04005 [Cecembia lonarensis LW9]